MSTNKYLRTIIFCIAMSGLSMQANALLINTYTDQAAFETAAGTLNLEDFSGEKSGHFTSRDFGDFRIDLINQAVTVNSTPEIIYEMLRLQVFDSESVSELTFDTGISALGFDWRNRDISRDTIELLVDGQSWAFGPGRRSGFFGIIATDGLFSVAGLSDTVGGGGALSTANIDNIRYGASTVPEPATLALFGIGLAGMGFARKKRKSA